METVQQKKVAPMKRLPSGLGLSSGFHLAVPSGLKGAESPSDSWDDNLADSTAAFLPACPVQSSGSRTKAPCCVQASEERARSANSGDVWGRRRLSSLPGTQSACKRLYLEGTAERAEVTRQEPPCQPRFQFSYAKNAGPARALGR